MAAIPFRTLGTTLAAKYAGLATPGGADPIRSSAAGYPNQLPARPCVLVFLDQLALDQAPGASRDGLVDYLVRLYYDELGGGDLERDSLELQDWLTVLADALQVGGTFTYGAGSGGSGIFRTVSARIAILPYAGLDYTGCEVRVRATITDTFQVAA